jgi:hypothetical protein
VDPATVVTIQPSSTVNTTSTVLPAGQLDSNGSLSVGVLVSDSLGATNETSINVTVEFSADASTMDSMMDTISELFATDVINANASNTQALTAMSTIASVLNDLTEMMNDGIDDGSNDASASSSSTDGSGDDAIAVEEAELAAVTVRSTMVMVLQEVAASANVNDTTVLELLVSTANTLTRVPDQLNLTAQASAMGFLADIVTVCVATNSAEDSQQLVSIAFPTEVVGTLSSLLEASVFDNDGDNTTTRMMIL